MGNKQRLSVRPGGDHAGTHSPYRQPMPASASLAAPRIDVVPGGSASLELTVRNTGAVVDEFRIEVLGPAGAWITPSPAVVPLFPGASAPVKLTVAPPRDASIAAGDLDVAVKIWSKEDPDGSTVEELVVAIGAFDDPGAELLPRTVRGGRKAKVQIAIDNHGNRRTQRAVEPSDPDEVLRFEADPVSAVVEPGRAEFVKLTIRPHKTFLRGPERTLPYKVNLTDGDSTVKLDGTYVQTPLLPRWLLRLLALLLVALLALLVLWQVALKPVIRSAARAAAVKQTDAAATKAATQTAAALGASPDAAAKAAADKAAADAAAKKAADDAAAAAAAGGKKAGAGGAGDAGGDDGKGGTSVDKRVAVEAPQGQTVAKEWKPGGEKDRFTLTDVVLQNPQGDVGLLRVKRGDEILLESALENFRDLDFHFIAPYAFVGKPVVVEVVCKNAADAQPCRAAASFAGFLAKAPATS